MSINNRIRELRKKIGLTQRELAEKISVSPQVISNWERNYTNPDHADVKKLSEIFECSTDYLLGTSDSHFNPAQSDKKEMKEFFSNPRLNVFFKEMADSPEEQLEELQEFWEIIKKRGLNKK
ncbi:helix-turn-helix transcriptional regulator [Domibacillus sp. A3M-37]|uniref:helix-turn-helix domain-containing protein n=1 Tax=Domibacillus sp. A3M-37 TaxID=2962037 RepID=UPI0020B8A599|nr:helix-turn-helix transcriptional regulator [Domibacillus sp. A3M-37]MCP3764061.1 helix-turn-helix transcriptional regulator [Domibacillus sp. A3M-37]